MKIIKNELVRVDLKIGLKSSLVVIGDFDGFHLYHQKLLHFAQKKAESEKLKLVFLTFDQKILNYLQKKNDNLISSTNKINFLQEHYQFDYYVELKVNDTLVNTSKEQFLDFLDQKIGVKMIVEGKDFSFGAQSTGKVIDLIKHFGADNTFIFRRWNRISSSKIRGYLKTGKIKRINLLLKRNLEVEMEYYLDEKNHGQWRIIYPQSPLKKGSYQMIDQQEQVAVFQAKTKGRMQAIKLEIQVPIPVGTHRFKIKKFLG